jgi:hypothetical protein
MVTGGLGLFEVTTTQQVVGGLLIGLGVLWFVLWW